MKNCRHLLIILCIHLTASIHAQDSPQDNKITISFDNVSTIDALHEVSKLTNINLSYNPTIIPKGHISKTYLQKTLEETLYDLLGEEFELKTIGHYVIIQKQIKKSVPKTTFKISGGITDKDTGKTLDDVSIYEINSLSATLSDNRGEFELSVSSKTDYLTFAVSRKNYNDTIIQVTQVEQLAQPLTLSPKREMVNELKNSFLFESSKIVQFFTSDKNKKNTENIQSVKNKYFQLSLVPAIGTNMTIGGQVTHNLSINLLAGYSYGLKGLEIGGLYNIDRKNVIGCQIGGLGNTVGGRFAGLQIGGIINTNKKYTKGVILGGVINVVNNDVKGLQVAGVTNITHSNNGLQMAGLSNYVNGRTQGVQLAGFNSHTKDMRGVQLSGFMNFAHKANGLQLAGFLNIAKTLEGIQLGVINYADSVSSGIPIGLISIVNKKGYFESALETNNNGFVTASLRTGLRKFYNILSIGIQFDNDELWTYGVGFGSQISLKNKLFTTIELRSNYLLKRDIQSQSFFNSLNKFHLNIGYQLFNHLSFTAGPVLNLYIANETIEGSGVYGYELTERTLYEKVEKNVGIKMWVGYNFSIRF